MFGVCLVFDVRSYLLRSLCEEGSADCPTEEKLQGYAAALAIGSARCKTNTVGKGRNSSVTV